MTHKDLPEDLQTSYEALKYLFESTMAQADADDALADLEVLTAPYRTAQNAYAAGYGVYSPHPAYLVRNQGDRTWTPWPDDRPAPTLLDLVLRAHEKHKEAQDE